MLNRIGATPFLMAAKSDDVALMRVLLELGADPSLTTNRGTTALMAAAGVGIWAPGENPGTHEEALAAVKLALEAGGGKVNDIDQDGETALHGAVYRGGAIPVIQFLIDKGAPLDVNNKRGWTPVIAPKAWSTRPRCSSGIPRPRRCCASAARAGCRCRRRRTARRRPQAPGPPAAAKTIWDGAFTEGQAGARAEASTPSPCAPCHTDDLLGASGPRALAAQTFLDGSNGSDGARGRPDDQSVDAAGGARLAGHAGLRGYRQLPVEDQRQPGRRRGALAGFAVLKQIRITNPNNGAQ